MRYGWIVLMLLIGGCGTKIEIKECDNSLVIIEQSSEQRTDNEIPISLTDASQVLKDIARLPKVVTEPVNKLPEEIIEDNDNADVVTEWKHTKAYNMQEISHGRPFYRFGIPGEQFGKTVLFTDEKGNKFLIPDTLKDTGDKANQFFFNGKGQFEHTFDGNASMFWYPTGSHSITAHFNGVE